MNNLRNQSGFSLVEVLAVAGMTTVVAMGSMSLMTSQLSTRKNAEVKAAQIDAIDEMQQILSNERTCAQSFRLASRIRSANSLPNKSNVFMTIGGKSVGPGNQLENYPLTMKQLYVENLKSVGKNEDDENLYLADLKAEFGPSSQDRSLLQIYKLRSISPIFFSVNASGAITKCSSISPETLSLVEICKYMLGTPNLSKKVCDLPPGSVTVIAGNGGSGVPRGVPDRGGNGQKR